MTTLLLLPYSIIELPSSLFTCVTAKPTTARADVSHAELGGAASPTAATLDGSGPLNALSFGAVGMAIRERCPGNPDRVGWMPTAGWVASQVPLDNAAPSRRASTTQRHLSAPHITGGRLP